MKHRPSLLYKGARRIGALLGGGMLIVTTPLVEKNPAKVLASRAPVVLSMARVVVLGFAVALLRQVWRAGIAGWPDATLSMAIVLALPVVGALERVGPREVVSLAKTMLERFGQGDVRRLGSVYAEPSAEPWKYDDHRIDEESAPTLESLAPIQSVIVKNQSGAAGGVADDDDEGRHLGKTRRRSRKVAR